MASRTGFLNLPYEIRQHIYQDALLPPNFFEFPFRAFLPDLKSVSPGDQSSWKRIEQLYQVEADASISSYRYWYQKDKALRQPFNSHGRHVTPGLLSTCRQAHKEGWDVLQKGAEICIPAIALEMLANFQKMAKVRRKETGLINAVLRWVSRFETIVVLKKYGKLPVGTAGIIKQIQHFHRCLECHTFRTLEPCGPACGVSEMLYHTSNPFLGGIYRAPELLDVLGPFGVMAQTQGCRCRSNACDLPVHAPWSSQPRRLTPEIVIHSRLLPFTYLALNKSLVRYQSVFRTDRYVAGSIPCRRGGRWINNEFSRTCEGTPLTCSASVRGEERQRNLLKKIMRRYLTELEGYESSSDWVNSVPKRSRYPNPMATYAWKRRNALRGAHLGPWTSDDDLLEVS